MEKNRQLVARATAALGAALLAMRPELGLSSAGAVAEIEQNLVPGVALDDFEADLRDGDGSELDGKFRAAHSSAALAVNTFAPFKRDPAALRLAGVGSFEAIRFEGKCPTGLRGGRAPNLDLLAEGPAGVVGVESKLTEHLRRHVPRFSKAYAEQIRDERRDGVWFREMLAVSEAPDSYELLDVAQLIKHAYGLARCFRGRPTTLLYLYWEPANADDLAPCRQHRAEVERLAARTRDGFPAFRAMSYPDLWRAWESAADPPWLAGHVTALRQRYGIAI